MKYTPKTVKEICDRIEQGDTQKDAAILANITEQTFYGWIEKYSDFSQAIQKATANYKSKLIKRIQKASDTSWQAGAWILERRFKEDYALRQEITGAEGKPVPIITLNIDANSIQPTLLNGLSKSNSKQRKQIPSN